jgi:hypothetical protein
LSRTVGFIPLLVVSLLEGVGAKAIEEGEDSVPVLHRRPGKREYFVGDENLVGSHPLILPTEVPSAIIRK